MRKPSGAQLGGSVVPRVPGGAPVQVDLEGLLFARGVADAMAGLQQAAALLLHQRVPLFVGQIHESLGAVPEETERVHIFVITVALRSTSLYHNLT